METEKNADIGGLLRKFRHRNRLTLEEVAELSGVSLRTISDLERGVRQSPHRYTLDALTSALKLTPQETDMLRALTSRVRSAPGTKTPSSLTLPRMIPDFTGREAELQRAMQILVSNRSPVITVTGPLGYGTTTFAIALARAAEEDFELTVYLPMVSPEKNTPLAAEEAARRLLHAIIPAARIGSDGDVIAQFQAALIDRRILFVCDDIEAEALIRPLLPSRGESVMILTSRLPLAGLDGVSHMALTPLDIADSIRLLESIIPEPQRTPEDTRALAIFCKNVPLGLRIAGNRVASLPSNGAASVLKSLASHTDRGLGAFRAGDRSLIAAFELAYHRLHPDQQTVFRRLCLSEGKFVSIEAVAVLAELGVMRAQTVVQELGELSIVEFDRDGRVRLDGFVDVFARMQIEADPDAAAARERADEYLQALS